MIPRELIGPLRAALPDADLDAATALGEGWAQVALRVPASGGDFVLWHPLLRNYDNAQHPDLRAMAIADLEREAKLLPELLAHGLPVPTEMLLLRDNDGRTIGSIHRLLEGDPITRSMLVGGRRKRLATALAEFFTRLHSFPSDRTTEPGLKSIDLWDDHYRPLVEGCRPLLATRSREWLDATVGRFLDEGGMAGSPRVLIHADIGPEHLRVDAGGAFAGSIDFGDAMVADPALDFAGLLLAYRAPFMEQVLARYGGEIDANLRRRAQFYADVVALHSVEYGDFVVDGQERIGGLRRIAVRAAAAARRATR
ncbi:MAG TPA: aminoglycoside phosphotransferase family protein [Dehalococcoidia bacterium]|nr:aminoglycoside phosphotransferase family protein [Dehalococcoidia bacterium]